MKKYSVYGLGNALVDILVSISDAECDSLGLEKATMRLVDAAEQGALLAKLAGKKLSMASAGSVANSMYCIGQLGGRAAFSASIGDDRYGLFYKNEFESLGISLPNSPAFGQTTGTCLVFITPDAERTMRTCLAVSSDFSADHVDEDILKDSEWVFIEGYLLANPGKVDAWLDKVLSLCKRHGTKIAFTCSEAWVLEHFKEPVSKVIAQASLVFANESEGKALAGITSGNAEDAFNVLKDKFEYTVITAGSDGAFASFRGEGIHRKSYPCTPVDLTGAGDALAGAFMYGITHGANLTQSLKAGCYLASKVISHIGARYQGDLKAHWKEA